MKKVITTILVLILVFLLGWIGYDLFIKNTEEINEENKVENLKILLEESEYLTDEDKIDSTMPFVYEIAPTYEIEIVEGIEEKKFINEFITTNEQVGEYSIPYINIKIDGIEKYNELLKVAALSVNQAKDSMYDKESTYLNYECNLNEDVYSIFIDCTIYGYTFKKGINIDIKNKKLLYLTDIILKYNLDENNLKKIFDENSKMLFSLEESDNNTGVYSNANYQIALMTQDDSYLFYFIDKYFTEEINNCTSKHKVFNNNEYLGYILDNMKFINDDMTIDKDALNEWRTSINYAGNQIIKIKDNEIYYYQTYFTTGNEAWKNYELKIK